MQKRICPSVVLYGNSISLDFVKAMLPKLAERSANTEQRAGELVHVPLHHNRKPLMSELAIYVRAGRNVPVGVDAFLRFAEEEILRRSVEAKGSAGRKAK